MKKLSKLLPFLLAVAMVFVLAFAVTGVSAKPVSTTTTTTISQYTNNWNHVNGASYNVNGVSLHWVLGGNGYTEPITMHIVYSNGIIEDGIGGIHGGGSIYYDSLGVAGAHVEDASISYYASEKANQKLTISHINGCITTTTTTEKVTTTTQPETTTTTEKETTTTTEKETTTTTQPETTTTTTEQTTTTTQPVTTTTQPQTTTTVPEPTTVTLVQTDDGQVISSVWTNIPFLIIATIALVAFLTIAGAALVKTRFDKK